MKRKELEKKLEHCEERGKELYRLLDEKEIYFNKTIDELHNQIEALEFCGTFDKNLVKLETMSVLNWWPNSYVERKLNAAYLDERNNVVTIEVGRSGDTDEDPRKWKYEVKESSEKYATIKWGKKWYLLDKESGHSCEIPEPAKYANKAKETKDAGNS